MGNFIRQTIRFSEHATRILRERAAVIWPEFDGNITGLTNKVIADWDRLRGENGGRTARLERLEADMALIKQHLGWTDERADHNHL